VLPKKNKIPLQPVNVKLNINLPLVVLEIVQLDITHLILVKQNALSTPFLMDPKLLVKLVQTKIKEEQLPKEVPPANALPLLPNLQVTPIVLVKQQINYMELKLLPTNKVVIKFVKPLLLSINLMLVLLHVLYVLVLKELKMMVVLVK